MEEMISAGLAQLGLSPAAAPALAEYGRLLLEKNKVMNLTALREPEQVARLHFLDCAALVTLADFQNKSVLDVGTGAGFPGMVLKIVEPTVELSLLDALAKRIAWLEEVAQALGLQGVRAVHARAEEQALAPGWRDGFDIVTSRAVADFRMLAELCLPFVKPGGRFIAMKSTDCQAELDAAAHCIGTLCARVEAVKDYTIPGTDVTHRAVILRKLANTPKGYPRRFAKIQKSPL